MQGNFNLIFMKMFNLVKLTANELEAKEIAHLICSEATCSSGTRVRGMGKGVREFRYLFCYTINIDQYSLI